MDTIGAVDAPLTGGVVLVSISVLAVAVLLFAIGRASGQFQSRRAQAIAEGTSDYWRVLLSDYYVNALPQATFGYWCGLLLALGTAGLGIWLLLNKAQQWTILADAIVGVMALILLELSNGSRRLMLAMITAVRTDRKFGESIRLAETLTEGHVKQRLLAILSLQFAGVTPGSVDGGVVKDTLWGEPAKLRITGSSSLRRRRCRKKKGKSRRLCLIC